MNRFVAFWFWTCVLLLALPVAGGSDQNSVTITEQGGYRIIEANGIPDHSHGKFPNRGNPNTIRAQKYLFRMPLNPRESTKATPVTRMLFGVALNGVPFDPGTAEYWNDDRSSGWRYEALSGKINLGIDKSNAHVQPSGAYHYHALPLGLISKLGGSGKVLQVGWAADGFAIYAEFCVAGEVRPSYRLKKGTRPNGPRGKYDGTFVQDYEFVPGAGDLDECNGHVAPTPENPKEVYHYHLTEAYPFVPRFFRGTPDASFEHKGHAPPGGRGRGGRRPPPRAGDPDPFEEWMLGR